MSDLPLYLAGLVAVVSVILAIVIGWAWLIVAAGAVLAGAVILWRRQRA